MFNKKILLISLVLILFIQPIFALTAESNDYSVARFGTGIQATNLSSSDLEARTISTTNPSTRGAESNDYTTNIGFWSNTTYYVGVSISSYSIYPTSAVQGSIIRFSISALNSESVWAVLTLPSGSQETIALTNNANTDYTANLAGEYSVTFYANSSSGALASVVDTFEITSSTIPTTPTTGRGGSTTIIEKTCNYNWDCTSWSICSDKKQTRKCNNIGTCNGTENKSIETRDCSDALFDVSLKFKDLTLTKNETLRFSVDLTETKGVEKIDVNIKYSILNFNNTEIFSQIETKAIKGNLSFEKEIHEIKFKDGVYILRIDIIYGNLQRAFAEERFNVKNGEIKITESLLAIQKTNIFILIGMGALVVLIILFILYSLIKFNKILRGISKKVRGKNFLEKELKKGEKFIELGKTKEARSTYERLKRVYNTDKKTYKEMYPRIIKFYNHILNSKELRAFAGLSGLAILIIYLMKINRFEGINGTGRIIQNLIPQDLGIILIPLIIIVPMLLIILRKKVILIYKKIIKFLSKTLDKEHPSNSIKGLVNKKVYSESGHYIGKIKEIILEENKINSLKIKIDKKHKFKSKGITINYNQVKGAGKVIIISEKVLEYVKDDKKLNS